MVLKQVDNTQIYALAEHVELLRAGWWEDAIDRTLQYQLYLAVQGLSEEAIIRQTQNELDARHDRHLIQQRLDRLTERGNVLRDGKSYYLTEKVREEYGRIQAEAEDLQERTMARYERVLHPYQRTITHLPSWEEFSQELLIPVINELGARTLELLRGEMPVPRTAAYSKFIAKFQEDDRMAVQSLIISFLDPEDSAVRSYIHSYLNHYMLVKSSSLDKKTLDRIANGQDSKPSFKILLDTNILFSILNLHYNPANAAAEALVELTKVIGSYADVGLYVLSRTLEEAKTSLASARDQAPRGRVTRPMAQAAQEVGNISGLVGRYIELATQGSASSPRSYFDDLIEGLEIILEAKGIVILSEGFESIEDRRSYKDAVDKWYSFEFDKQNGRGRNQVMHDVLCITFVKDRRQGKVAGFARSEWWFLTADFGLQSYEKSITGRKGVPLSINPAEMVQMLRFWVPRSDRLESALVGGIRLPFSFFHGERNMHKTSLEILDRMSRYSNVESFSTELAERLLTDKALRASVESGKGDSEEEKQRAFESALAEDVRALEKQAEDQRILTERLKRELEEAKRKSASDASIAAGKASSKASLQAQAERTERAREKERKAAKARAASHQAELQALQEEVDTLKALEDEKQAVREGRAVLRKTWLTWCSFILLTLVLFAGCIFVANNYSWSFWLLVLAVISSLFVSLWMSLGLTKMLALSVTSRTVRLFKICATNLWSYLGAGFVALVITLVVAPPK
ncbi:hypothetical protein [Pseudarthrobacter quantipunctorum]|uniref:PIN like domain-containing protein n=1 Tax=Pseudarthrobacter quantipunctorum TaxID=3128980 RepID=A0ABZ2R6P5_9MICC